MAIVVDTDNASGLIANTPMTQLSWSHTVAAGAERVLVVGVAFRSDPPPAAVSGVTYAGLALTKTDGTSADMVRQETDSPNITTRIELWKLVDPPVGSDVVVVSFAGAATRSSGAAVTAYGVDLANPLGTWATATAISTGPATVNVASAAGEVVIDLVGVRKEASGEVMTEGAGQTRIRRHALGVSPGGVMLGMSHEPGATSVTMSWTLNLGGARRWVIGGVPLKPSPEVSPPIATGAKVAEMGVIPLRRAPDKLFFPARRAIDPQNYLSLYELSGLLPKVYRIQLLERGVAVLDDFYTLPDVSPPGALAATQLATKQSLDGSLVVGTQSRVYQFPAPRGVVPQRSDYPHLVTHEPEGFTGAARMPAWWRPSAIDFSAAPGDDGRRLYEVVGIDAVLVNEARGTDWLGVTYCWDEFGPWAPVQWKTGSELRYEWGTEGRRGAGRMLRLWCVLWDGESVEPVVPEHWSLQVECAVSDRVPGTGQPLRGVWERS